MAIRLRTFFIPAVLIACGALLLNLVNQVPSESELRVRAYADEMDIPFFAYPSSLIELLERNPETESFVLNYPFHQDGEVDLSGYDPSRGVPLFLQWDEQWGYQIYDGDMMAITGSGPMCLAMAGYYVSGGDEKFSPDRVADFIMENAYWSNGNSQDGKLISNGGTALGLSVKELPREAGKVKAYLHNGDPVIAAMGPGDFGDYIVLAGYDNGKIIINDPDSRINSGKAWFFEEISDQIRNLWVIRTG